MALKVNDLVSFVKKAYLEDWGYVLGAQGETWTKELAEKWAVTRNKPSSWIGTKRSYFVDACARWFYHKVADCSGLIITAFRECKNPYYSDKSADTLYDRCVKKGSIKTIPETPGLCVWKKGHIGVYIGGGYAIESRGYKYGVVKTKVKDRPWTNWGELKDVDYSTGSGGGAPEPEAKYKYAGASYTNLRTKASILGKKIGKINRGDIITKLENVGNWWKVKTSSGQIGYCANTRLFKKL
jgi:hypothetical protein